MFSKLLKSRSSRENRFKADKNDDLFKEIFTDELLNKIIENDINVKFINMKIHLDDTIENIKNPECEFSIES